MPAAKITTYSVVSRAVDSRNFLLLIPQNITRASDRVNQRPRITFVDGVAQPAHVHIDDVGLRIEVQIPDSFEQHGARDDLAGPAHQVFQQLELLGGEVDVLAGAHDASGEQVEFQ